MSGTDDSRRRPFLRRMRRGLLVALVLLAGLGLTVFGLVRGSLPRLDGELRLVGLEAAVTVERDDLGVPRILAGSRVDAARALGFLHGQDRFFQMDLLRRRASGELSELLGSALLSTDRENRRHAFAEVAQRVVARCTPRQRSILEAYVGGVNAGLEALRVRPFEYLLLRSKPRPWTAEDCVLVACAMHLELSLGGAQTESMLGVVHDLLAPMLADFLSPRGNPWEAPMQGEPFAIGAIPTSVELPPSSSSVEDTEEDGVEAADRAGSNAWAVGGAHTSDGRGILANDMHLGLTLPNIWYRAEMHWLEPGGSERRVVGVTLPGAPSVIAGTNGEVAWGLTNSYGDFADLVEVEVDPLDSTRYRTPEGFEAFGRRPEVILVAGGSSDTLSVPLTRWGPLWDVDHRGRSRALRWTAHDPRATDFTLLDLEEVRDVEEAVAVAARCGIPPQNFVCTDRRGRVAWTVAGLIPRRREGGRRIPSIGSDARTAWEGYLSADEHPRIIDPPEARVWTANARVVDGEMLRRLGDGGYALGARARQIRDDLRRLSTSTEQDMLALQLDDRALFLDQWRQELLELFTRRPPDPDSKRGRFARWLEEDWDGHASIGSVSYRLVRGFRLQMIDAVYGYLAARCYEEEPRFRIAWLPHTSAVVLELLRMRPQQLLPPDQESWDAWMLKVVDEGVDRAESIAGSLEEFRWGKLNTVRLRHPLSYALPQLMRWLSLDGQELPGGSFMPRVQHPRHGASERMVVSPGHEEDAIFHMPGGQSGHPLSPFFAAGHRDWVEGRPTPLLVGETRHRLQLQN